MAQEGETVRQVTLSVSVGYAKSILGIIKVIQFVLLLLTWACMADCCVVPSGTMFGGRYSFYLFVTIFGWLCILFIYLAYLFLLVDKVKVSFDKQIVVLVFDILWAFLLLISASLVAEVANAFAAVAVLHGGSAKAPGAMVAAVGLSIVLAISTTQLLPLGLLGLQYVDYTALLFQVFGFFALVAFIVDIVFLIIKIVKSRRANAAAVGPESPTPPKA